MKRIIVAVALAVVMLLTGAASGGCDEDCPTPRNKGVCING